VQPVVVFELPLTVLIAAWVFGRRLDRHAVAGTLAVSAGVSMVLIALAPRRGGAPTGTSWALAVGATLLFAVLLVAVGMRSVGSRRSAVLGVVAGVGFGFTAALMNGALQALSLGVSALWASWQLYAMVLAGIASVFLTQNALQAGPIVAAQPAITSFDPLASVAYGVVVFGEQLRGGYWLILAAVGGLIGVAGTVLVTHSPLIEASSQEESTPDQR
jgi:drug/metabolite transporter (DMT)-like permease